MSEPEKRPEGWQAYKSQATRRYHFINSDTMALCRGLGFYMDAVTTHRKGQPRGSEDCAKCYKLAEAR
jgi:hypothetical protein